MGCAWAAHVHATRAPGLPAHIYTRARVPALCTPAQGGDTLPVYSTDGEILFRRGARVQRAPGRTHARSLAWPSPSHARARMARHACGPMRAPMRVNPRRQDAYMHYLFGVMEDGAWGAIDTRDVSVGRRVRGACACVPRAHARGRKHA